MLWRAVSTTATEFCAFSAGSLRTGETSQGPPSWSRIAFQYIHADAPASRSDTIVLAGNSGPQRLATEAG